LLQHNHIPAAFAPSPKFIDTLTDVVEEQITAGLQKNSEDTYQTLLRAKRLLDEKMGGRLQSVNGICLWKLLEENIDWARDPEHTEKRDVALFDWKCAECGGRHALQVDEE
jgi:hypothetical protein